MTSPHPIVPREKLNFDLEGDIPRHWFAGDPFKSRFFDAMSTLFPEGEKYFMASVRAYKDDIQDPKLAEEVRLFIRQEAQHGMIHMRYNERLGRQGFDIDKNQRILKFLFHKFAPALAPRIQRLTDSAATEHLTAILAHCLFTDKHVMAGADPRVRAMYAWHSIEEVEHKAVIYDVLVKVAKPAYLRRAPAILGVSFGFNLYSLIVTNALLKLDGFGRWQRLKMMSKGWWWLFKPAADGLYWPVRGLWAQYFKRDFHPWQMAEDESYKVWLDAFEKTGDPIAAGEAVYAAAQ